MGGLDASDQVQMHLSVVARTCLATPNEHMARLTAAPLVHTSITESPDLAPPVRSGC
jgi:hypothetical protein